MSMDLTIFESPSSEYKPAPLWVWNDEMTVGIIRKQLEALRECGFGGAFVHPRPGLVTPYLSEEWFALWTYALQMAEQWDLKLYIYDENSYPSGFAGGHVVSELPNCLANSIHLRWVAREELSPSDVDFYHLAAPGRSVRIFAAKKEEGDHAIELLEDLTLLPLQDWHPGYSDILLVEAGTPEPTPWLGGFAFVDLLRPEVAELFIKTTYEPYREKFGSQFGTRIPAIFTDEPGISLGQVYKNDFALPYSKWFALQFLQLRGYDLDPYLPHLFMDVKASLLPLDARKVRYDYYCTLRELFERNFIKPISAWCERHGIAWTGHFMEHQWPDPWGGIALPATMSMYAHMQWPGIDMLMTHLLKEDGTDKLLLTIREVQSVANQLAKERVVCESYGAGGYDASFADFKRIGDWLVVNGVTFINQHLTYSTIVGARKRDHPQSFDWRQPWWSSYKDLNEYYGRLSYCLSQGSTQHRILLLHPTTTAFLEARMDHPMDVVESLFHGRTPHLMETYIPLIQWLSDSQWDYDLGDEFIIEQHGRVQEGKVHVGCCEYSVVVIPEAMKQLNRSTLRLLEQFAEQGGHIVAMGSTIRRIHGECSDEAEPLFNHPSTAKVRTIDDMHSLLKKVLFAPSLEWQGENPAPTGIAHRYRIMEDGSGVLFIVNSSPDRYIGDFQVAGQRIEQWDAWTGAVSTPLFRAQGKHLLVSVELPPGGSLLFRVNAENQGRLDSPAGRKRADIQQAINVPGEMKVQVLADNMLTLDYCDLQLFGTTYQGIHVTAANHLIYQAHGHPANPWDSSIQYKNRLIHSEPYPANTGFSLQYHFHVAAGASIDRLRVLVERSGFYRLKVNDRPVTWTQSESWLDHRIGSADIASMVREGRNTLLLEASPFHILLEAEAVYLEGSFGVGVEQERWVLTTSRTLEPGSWKDQGYPFYSRSVSYSKLISYREELGNCRILLPEWSGTSMSLVINGNRVGLVGLNLQNQALDITDNLRIGDNTVALVVTGSLKNLLGPHHDPAKPRHQAWPGQWKCAPMYGPPAASSYDVMDYGLNAPFEIQWLR